MTRELLLAITLFVCFSAQAIYDSDTSSTKKLAEDYRNFLSVGGGLSYVPGRITSLYPEEKDPAYFESLRRGFHFHVEIARFQSSGFGIGAKYWGFRNSGSSQITVASGNILKEEPVRDNIATHFFGAMLMYRKSLNGNAGIITATVFLGQTYFKNQGTLITNYSIRGSSGSAGLSLDWEKKLDKNIGFILRAAGAVGKMRNYDLSTGLQTVRMEPSKDKYGSLAHLGLTAGFRFHF